MQIKRDHVFFGSNPYSKTPIIIYSINVDEPELLLAKRACFQITEAFPQCFSDIKLDDATIKTYIGSVLSTFSKYLINDSNGCIESAGTAVHSKELLVWLEFHHVHVSSLAMKTVLNIFQLFMSGEAVRLNDIQSTLNSFHGFCKNVHPRRTPFLEIALEDNIPMSPYPSIFNAWQFGWGNKSRIFIATSPMEDSYHGVKTSLNKTASIRMLRNIGVPTAKSVVINKKEELIRAEERIGYPCVVKPIKGTQGTGVTANIHNCEELQLAYDYARASKYGKNPLLVEAFVEGDSYRIMISNGEFIGAIKRKPSYVIGDGRSTLKELIEELNKKRLSLKSTPAQLMPVKLEASLMAHIKNLGISLGDVINNSDTVTLSSVAGHSSGAIIENVTDSVHPQNIHMCKLIAQASGIANLGVDYITKNISKPFNESNGVVIEYNHHPSVTAALFTLKPKEALRLILNVGSGRIPMILIILNPINLIVAQGFYNKNIKDKSIGWVCGDKAYIGQLPLSVSDITGWESIKILLRNKAVEKTIIVCSDVDIIEKGLPIDKADLICMHDVNLTESWDSVIDSATPRVEMYTDLNALLCFTLNEI